MITRASIMTLLSTFASGCLDAAPRVPVPQCIDEQRECVSYRTVRTCVGGVWQESDCDPEDICEGRAARCEEGQTTCLGLLLCYFDCPDTGSAQDKQACSTACAQAATVPAVNALLSLNNCQCDAETKKDACWPLVCPDSFFVDPFRPADAIAECVAERCSDEGAKCVGQGVVGTASCDVVRACVVEDCRGDTFCAQRCYGLGDEEAQTIAGFYHACLRAECGANPTSACLFEAQTDACEKQYRSCLDDVAGQPMGTGDRP